MSVCTKCGILKKNNEFYSYTRFNAEGFEYLCFRSICKKCDIKGRTLYQKENQDKIKEYRKIYYKKNKDILKDNSNERCKEWMKNNKERRKEYLKIYNIEYLKKRREEPLYKLKTKIRKRIWKSIKSFGLLKNKTTVEILGCSSNHFLKHIETQFQPWMNWDNYGKYNGDFNYGWDLDHIIPISSAKTEKQVYELNHYTNFQPLCSKVNRDVKKDKMNK